MSTRTIQFMGEEVTWQKPDINFFFHTKWKLDMIRLMSDKPVSIHTLESELPVSIRTILRTIEYLPTQGFHISRTKQPGQARLYQITSFPAEFSEMISDLFHSIHQTEQRSCATISAN